MERDDTRMTAQASAAMVEMSAWEWDETFTSCPRCGTWGWSGDRDIKSGCSTCRGKEIEGDD